MSGRSDRERVLGYLRRKGRDAPSDRVRSKVGSTLAKLESVLSDIGSERAISKPDPTTWCVQEIVNHLTLSLEPAIVEVHSVIDGTAAGPPIPAGLLDVDAMESTWAEAVERLSSAHARFLEALDRAVETDPPLERTVPALMLLQVDDGAGNRVPLEWVEPLDWKSFAIVARVHTLEHVDQIRRVLERVDLP